MYMPYFCLLKCQISFHNKNMRVCFEKGRKDDKSNRFLFHLPLHHIHPLILRLVLLVLYIIQIRGGKHTHTYWANTLNTSPGCCRVLTYTYTHMRAHTGQFPYLQFLLSACLWTVWGRRKPTRTRGKHAKKEIARWPKLGIEPGTSCANH